MAFDSLRGVTVMFGGGSFRSDTWEWDGSNWLGPLPSGPGGRIDHAMAYDDQRYRTVLFGGWINNGNTVHYPETWALTDPANTFGVGCGIPALELSPVLGAGPTIGSTARCTMANVPSTLAFVALGWSRSSFGAFALPLTLAGFGMPGCTLLQSSDAPSEAVSATGPSTATYSLALPNMSGLIGLRLYLQGWAFAPGANAGNTIVSNGVEWRISA